MGRPRLAKTPKSVLVGARVGKEEERQIERDAKQAGKSKSEYVRERLLGAESQTPPADLRKFWFRSRILTLDGQEIATGPIKLRTAPDVGTFVPDHPPSPSADILQAQKLVAKIGTHRFELEDWEYCGATMEQGLHNLGPHFHFLCP